jgi:DNA-binding transcriptional regulator YhcF (GntR family)
VVTVKIESESPVTLYEQLRTQIIGRIENGELIVGTKLPPVRQLATELGVAPYTVARVYRILENDGFVETRGRNGTVVSGTKGTASETLQALASAYAARASELGVPAADALQFARSALEL